MLTDEQRKALNEEECHCILCDICNGKGYDVLGYDEYCEVTERCGDCDGGISEVCDRCQLLEEDGHDRAK